jgi:hypothetical protein
MKLPENGRAASYLRTLVIISGGLVLATVVLRFGYASFLAPLNLTNENVAAAWFSGMLLLLGSLHAADGYFRLRHTNLAAALAWCVIAGMLLYLSADEIGSIHERIDDVAQMGPWLSFLPFLVVLLGCCAWSFIQLWNTPSERSRVPGLILGFGILVSVGGQEFIEKAFRWPWYLSPFRSGLEEGSELCAMLILIYTMLPNSAGLFSHARQTLAPAFSMVGALRWPVALAAAAIAWPASTLSASLDLQNVTGHFSDWLACALFSLSAALILHNWISSPREAGSFPAAAIFWLCVASVLCVQIDPIGDSNVFPFSRSLEVYGVVLSSRLVLIALCCLGAAESLRARDGIFRTSAIVLLFVAMLSVVLSMYSAEYPLRWGYFATTAVAVAAFASLAGTLPERSAESRPPLAATASGY